jgi:uncharacterized protein (TIGR02001 family)
VSGLYGPVILNSEGSMNIWRKAGISSALFIAAAAQPALAEQQYEQREPGGGVSGELTYVSDYRFRGLTMTNQQAAVQGTLEYALDAGWAFGVWTSSLPADDGGSDMELAVSAERSFQLGALTWGLGVSWYHYPTFEGYDYGEAKARFNHALGDGEISLGFNHAWAQEAIGGVDNTYAYASFAEPVARLAENTLSASASVGYEESGMALEAAKWDWSLGLALDLPRFAISVSYVDASIKDRSGQGAVGFGVGAAF